MTAYADLHMHSLRSDGMHRPAELPEMAARAGLAAIALTDHDTMAGVEEAAEAGERIGIEVVPGVEISTADGGQDIHVLGYFVDPSDPLLRARLESQRDVRKARNRLMIEALRAHGVDITLEEVAELAARSGKSADNLGRPHIADCLVHKGYAAGRADAFDRWIGKGAPAYVLPPRIAPEEAVDWIREAGGAAVLAHPGLYGDEPLVERLIAYGLDGIEAYHSDHTPEQERAYAALAERHGLVATAGSDFHGSRGGEAVFHGPVGHRRTPVDTIKRLRERIRRL
ncbi:PHP domain-containing protein [Paenibacillus thermoaerophilus]|uniref:PHP domain-containing protein n=1 Tax=Paenibacillus thermoaerophilus TaxID=1215385 RepID=A0ABW2V3B1_9BACL|nr:PHP domain-containing protein [Paenibacillus thermoaerophilus]TMV19138.1 PHP domain-containing protein [Paenibacillus thermoaerophilus]